MLRIFQSPLGFMIAALTYFSGICRTKFSKKWNFFKKPHRILRAFPFPGVPVSSDTIGAEPTTISWVFRFFSQGTSNRSLTAFSCPARHRTSCLLDFAYGNLREPETRNNQLIKHTGDFPKALRVYQKTAAQRYSAIAFAQAKS